MRDDQGFSIVSILTALLLTSILMAGAFTMLSTHTKAYNQQDLAMAMEQNLRVAVDQLGDALRSAGSAAPATDLAAWVPWVTGFDTNPRVVGSPARLSVARCTSLPVAFLSAPAGAGALTLSVDSAVPGEELDELLDTGARRLIAIDDVEHAHLTFVGSSSVEIDTAPTVSGAQGLSRAFAAGTPICRVDVTTYGINVDGEGASHLFRDLNQGDGPLPFADAIADLQVTPLVAGKSYAITLIGRSNGVDPLSEAPLQRTVRSFVSVRNAG